MLDRLTRSHHLRQHIAQSTRPYANKSNQTRPYTPWYRFPIASYRSAPLTLS